MHLKKIVDKSLIAVQQMNVLRRNDDATGNKCRFHKTIKNRHAETENIPLLLQFQILILKIQNYIHGN